MNRIEYNSIGETLYETTLENGLKIFVVSKKDFKKKYAFFATRYGGSDRRFVYNGEWLDTPAGIAHFLEHKMFDTEDGSALTTLSKNGASVNAFTGNGITAYHVESTDHFEENLETLLSFVSVPSFTKDSVDKEQGIIGQEIGMMEDKPPVRVYYNLMEALYAHNPTRETIAGTVESIAQITAETLYSCHNVFYNPANMVLCVVGDIDPKMVTEKAEKILSPEKGGPGERDYGPEESPLPLKKEVKVSMPVSAPTFLLGCKVKPAPEGQMRIRQMLEGELALNLIAGLSSSLYSRLYAQGLISKDFGGDISYFPGSACILFGGESREPEKVADAIKEEIASLLQNGPNLELLTQIKKAMTGEYLRKLNSFDTIARSMVQAHFSGYDFFESFDLFQAITAEQVLAFAKENFAEDCFALSVVYPLE